MNREYRCPKCKAMLNPDRSVILTATHGDICVLIGFHPQPGNYEVYLPPGVRAKKGSKWDFACPVCQASLTAEEADNLCELELCMEGKTLRLFFSRIAGEQATFVVREDDLKEKHGADLLQYDPLWAQLKYIRY